MKDCEVSWLLPGSIKGNQLSKYSRRRADRQTVHARHNSMAEVTLIDHSGCLHTKSSHENWHQCWEKSAEHWVECLFSFNTGRGGRRIERRKGAKHFFLCRNVARHITSVEQSFLIKTEGLDGRVLHFTLDSLNPRRHCRSVPVCSPVGDRQFPCSAAHSQHCFRHEQNWEKRLGELGDFGRAGVGVRRYHLVDIPSVTCGAVQN